MYLIPLDGFGLCIYLLVVWSNFDVFHNSQFPPYQFYTPILTCNLFSRACVKTNFFTSLGLFSAFELIFLTMSRFFLPSILYFYHRFFYHPFFLTIGSVFLPAILYFYHRFYIFYPSFFYLRFFNHRFYIFTIDSIFLPSFFYTIVFLTINSIFLPSILYLIFNSFGFSFKSLMTVTNDPTLIGITVTLHVEQIFQLSSNILVFVYLFTFFQL